MYLQILKIIISSNISGFMLQLEITEYKKYYDNI